MTSLSQRKTLLQYLDEACQAGARLVKACTHIGITMRTLQRWRKAKEGDRRQSTLRKPHVPPNKLSAQERADILQMLNSEPFKHLPPSQIVPRLADQNTYMASESTLYRILRQEGQLAHRRLERAPQKRCKPRALVAQAVNQIYCWDITYLPSVVRGSFFYLYLYVDIFSRKIVGWQVFDTESAQHAADLLLDICKQHQIEPGQLTVHSDNGAPMKGQTMLAMMQALGVVPSRSRPSVSNDNPYSESLFKTLKYRPEAPPYAFANIAQARSWAQGLVDWYNQVHRHSAIGFTTPEQRHAGRDKELLLKRTALFEKARAAKPNRWSKHARNWHYKDAVHLNPDATHEEHSEQ